MLVGGRSYNYERHDKCACGMEELEKLPFPETIQGKLFLTMQ
jgi:hypothetical protein